MSQLIRVESLSVSTEQGVLVDPVSFELHEGRPLTILGETGAGKSLIAAALTGTLPKELKATGQIYLSERLVSDSELQLTWGKQIALLPQEPWLALDPIMPVHKQIEEVHTLVNGQTEKQAKPLTEQALQSMNLSKAKSQYPFQLSGGMAQRIAYLCATQAGGELLLADEPTKGLDRAHCHIVGDMLAEHAKHEGLITITHDIELAQNLGGDIIVMKQGAVVESGDTQSVLANPTSAYTKQLIESNPRYWTKRTSAQTQQTLLNVDKLSLQRNKSTLFNDVSFTLNQGEVLGVCGQSGCGKTSLADTILGLLTPASGEIVFHQPIAVGQKLKLYQDPPSAFPAHVNLNQLLRDLQHIHPFDFADIAPLMARLKLDASLLERTPREISGGELQRFAILRALLLKPKLLIADEPTSRLDPITAAETLQLLTSLATEQQCSLLVIGHDETALEKLCDKVINLHHFAPETMACSASTTHGVLSHE
ncbi:ATP-binding cassette domain-containing protein [Vibrio europaeus]|uniref:ABC transporter ATP-binding protein n=1 Tax=Vibrio europaeus TaxID=300876 RepID=UPI00233F4E4C|nr:ATP-binding cassette domain-containing protein [Vibrio europaeus]MDC5818401.1 ATP-binding cassette domain-containing protein [Vibrio europaeus]MDC5871596.1 ATP-binding cassette domain-containing protein [Vibrio europaeus]